MKSKGLDYLSINKIIDLTGSEYNNFSVSYKIKRIIIYSSVIIAIMTLATFLSFLFRIIGYNESNIIMVYILGVLLTSAFTDGYFYGISASIIGVLTFNFFFTEPYYTFLTYRSDYPVTFAIMLISAIITSTLTTKVKQEAKRSSLREKRTQILYYVSKSLLKVRNINQIIEVGVTNIAKLLNRSVIISTINVSDKLSEPYIFPFDNDERADIFKSFNEKQVIHQTFISGNPAGMGTDKFSGSSAYYLPIKGQSGTLGVVGISCFDDKFLSDEQKTLLDAVTTQIALAIERERLSEKQNKSKIEIERERLRGNLLRAMSHDLRTPLTGIIGSTATILDNDDVLNAETKKKLLQDVYEDANWLMHSIENILSITMIDEGKIGIKKNMEAVEEIVSEALSRVKKITAHHTIRITIPNELIMLQIDGILIEQVIVNLLDNAIRYTPHGSIIEIKIWDENKKVVFEVSDNGNGILEEDIPYLFKRFYTASVTNHSGRRGTGLGLAICKSIITSHDGEITVYNNDSGGATFRFELPQRSDNNEQ